MGPKVLHVLLTTELAGNELWWVAQCLELDLAAQARTVGDVELEFRRMLEARLISAKELGVDPFAGLQPAPKRYWRLFRAAKRLERAEFKPDLAIDDGWELPPEWDARVA